MDRYPSTAVSTTRESVLATNKVLRNTYLLLGATLAFSAAMAGVSMALNLPYFGLLTLLVYFGLLFAVHKTKDSAWGIVWTFALTGFLGLTLGPILEAYIRVLPNGSQIVMTSLGVTAAAFLGLSAYAVTSKKDFSFIGGFLAIGAIGAFVLGLVAYFFNLPTLSLVVSGMFLIVSGGYILWQTSEIIRGGETNYIVATVTLYIAIYNMFLSLLRLLGAASNR
ncbi:MAG TPA: Bax inhibitor-1/YccA family protein [Steroidobacteraceae bacterium]|jgi:modulator of FtsH protease|nr:Bax inhibitor-1/YccA family protein [Steroidobacteraceae bacterium]HJY36405.1 Bax inhibitor-1/YccA family protein [Steroidobacteraceae bacterium]HJY41110.1 Bax inhibitor-1/YccA family protein [Steroidobacteraceae bacterium]